MSGSVLHWEAQQARVKDGRWPIIRLLWVGFRPMETRALGFGRLSYVMYGDFFSNPSPPNGYMMRRFPLDGEPWPYGARKKEIRSWPY